MIIIGAIYALYDPYQDKFFPPCPFHEITGLKCPGCGSQRAIHYLINLKFVKAIYENVLMVISIPYIIISFVLDIKKQPGKWVLRWRKILFGEEAIYAVLGIIILFWIFRNVFGF